LTLIDRSGVRFTLALDLEHRLVSFRNYLSFAGIKANKEQLIRDLIRDVQYAPSVYGRPLHQVAFDQLDPNMAAAELEGVWGRLATE
jgi:hypothetical protein